MRKSPRVPLPGARFPYDTSFSLRIRSFAGANSNGQLGDGTTNKLATPVVVAGGRNFRSINCGFAHSCALDSSGKAWCWGASA